MNDERNLEIEEYELQFWNIIEQSLNIKLEGISISASSNLNEPIAFNARIPTKNYLLSNTPYLYTESNKLLHFTTLSNLLSIINEGSLRLYNLNNSNDATEYLYASESLKAIYMLQGIREENINSYFDRVRENTFIHSCTSTEGLSNKDFWEKYGDLGKGVAIEFEIINPVTTWEYFYCSKIQYDKLNTFDKLKQNWIQIQTKNKINSYYISLNQLYSLHKSRTWANEQEIRILTLFPEIHTEPYKSRVFKDFKPNHVDKNIKYFKLPLCDKTGKFIDKGLEERNECFWSIIPRLRISDIYLGPNFLLKNESIKFQEELKYYVAEKMDCWLKELPRILYFN